MLIRNTTERYGAVAQLLHWGIFALFIFMFVTIKMAHGMPDSPEKFQLYGLHKATGILIFLLVAFRLVWRFTNPVPTHHEQKGLWLHQLVLVLLYVCMIGMPVSGYIMSMAGGYDISFYGLFDLPDFIGKNKQLGGIAHQIHGIGEWMIYIVVGLHAAAAFAHHFIKKDDTLSRMLPACPMGCKKGD